MSLYDSNLDGGSDIGSYFYSAAAHKGDVRENMEDAYAIHKLTPDKGETYTLFMVLDGHGGVDAVHLVLDMFPTILEDQLSTCLKEDVKTFRMTAIRRAFNLCEKEAERMHLKSGTTLSIILFEHKSKEAWSANVGDSTTYVKDEGCKIRKISQDHSVHLKCERERVEKTHVIDESYISIKGGDSTLNMTRSIGDIDIVTDATPYIKKIPSWGKYIVMATDGVWDVMTPKEIANIWSQCKDPTKCADYILQIRNEKEQHDNSCIITIEFINKLNNEEE